jgi:hypothetical protein
MDRVIMTDNMEETGIRNVIEALRDEKEVLM